MKDHIQVFDERLKLISLLWNDNNINACTKVSTDLIKYALLIEYKDGVMVSETLENVFSQIAPVFKTYEVSEMEHSAIKTKVSAALEVIQKTYKQDNKHSLFDALKEIRFAATDFQLKTYTRKQKQTENEGYTYVARNDQQW